MTIESDAFEDAAERHIRTFCFPTGVNVEKTRAVLRTNPAGRADHYRPDFRVWLPRMEFLVADAKCRKRLTKVHVERLRDYKNAIGSKRAIVYVPEWCTIQRGAETVAAAEEIGIVLLPWPKPHPSVPTSTTARATAGTRKPATKR